MAKSPKIEARQVEFSPRGYSNPFGEFGYSNGKFTTTPSGEESSLISMRQKLLQQLLPELGQSSGQRAAQIQSYKDLYTQQILDKAMPLLRGEVFSKGLAGSTEQGAAFNDLIVKAIRDGVFAGEDLFQRDETSKLNRVNTAESGLQQAFARLLGIGQEGRALNDQYFANENNNANRLQQADANNAAIKAQQNAAMMNALGSFAGLASMAAMPGLSQFWKGIGNGGAPASMKDLYSYSGYTSPNNPFRFN